MKLRSHWQKLKNGLKKITHLFKSKKVKHHAHAEKHTHHKKRK